jgi:hypothetical protein
MELYQTLWALDHRIAGTRQGRLQVQVGLDKLHLSAKGTLRVYKIDACFRMFQYFRNIFHHNQLKERERQLNAFGTQVLCRF